MSESWRNILIFLMFFLTYAYFYNPGGGNQAARMNQTRAIATRATLYSDGMAYPSDDHLYISGHIYSNKAPGTSFMGVLPFAMARSFSVIFGLESPFWQNWEVHFTTMVAVGIPSALAMLCLYLFLLRVGLSPPISLLGALTIGLGTTYFSYATMFFSHSLAGAMAFLAFFLLHRAFERRRKGLETRYETGYETLGAALLTSAAVITEYPLVIAALLLSLYLLLTRPGEEELKQWAIGGGIGVAALGLYNLLAFGDPFSLSYFNYPTSAHNTFPAMARGIGGVGWPDLEVARELLVGKARGLIWFSPALFLALPGLVYMGVKRRDLWRECLLVSLMIMFFFVFNSGYGDSIRYWGGANSAGPRHLIAMFPFAGIACAMALAAFPRAAAFLILPSVTVALAITSVMPQVPMLYFRPMEQFILPYFLQGRLAVQRAGIVSRDLLTGDSVAYNWGKLAGLSGSWSLLPLLLVVGILLILVLGDMLRKKELSRVAFWAGSSLMISYLVALVAVPLSVQRAQARPLSGPGVLGVYYPGKKCSGVPVRVAREVDFEFNYHRDIVRPYPGTFCARWITRLDVPETGEYGFSSYGGAASIRVGGNEIDLESVDGKKSYEAWTQLEAGEHSFTVEHVGGVVYNVFRLSWAPPEQEFQAIPEERLEVPEAYVDGIGD